ncbi:MAG TPA: HD domain-containing protein [Ktedonobacteraceae bacterium]|nr:HD domain-containing protein [Ktedonobacteraceae bacterium]
MSEHQLRPYLVGGSLRNLLLGEECLDWDIVTFGEAHKTARQLADTLGGHYVHMHAKASRVVVVIEETGLPQTRKEISFDISPLVGKTIEDDLYKRDFTINAIATPLKEVVRYLESNQETDLFLHLIDPLNGLSDLQARCLKAVNDLVFRHDPLRMLRAVRLVMRYQLQLDPDTANMITRDASLLSDIAWERIHDELYAILGPERATTRLHFLDEHGLFTTMFPEFELARGMRQPKPHYWDVLSHSIETVGTLEEIASLFQANTTQATDLVGKTSIFAQEDKSTHSELVQIASLLQEAEQQGIFSFPGLTAPRMKMAALLHDIGKPVTYSCDEDGAIHFYNHPQAGVPLVETVMRRLCASTQDRRLAQLVAAHHMRPGQLGQDGPVTLRAIRRYFVDLGPAGIYVALFSLADHLATVGPEPIGDAWKRHMRVVHQLLTSYIRERNSILPPRLISPEELMRRLKLVPGPIVGQLLDLISEAQAEGKVHSKEEAVWFAEEHLQL